MQIFVNISSGAFSKNGYILELWYFVSDYHIRTIYFSNINDLRNEFNPKFVIYGL